MRKTRNFIKRQQSWTIFIFLFRKWKTAGTIINTHKYFHKLDLKAALNNKEKQKKRKKPGEQKQRRNYNRKTFSVFFFFLVSLSFCSSSVPRRLLSVFFLSLPLLPMAFVHRIFNAKWIDKSIKLKYKINASMVV